MLPMNEQNEDRRNEDPYRITMNCTCTKGEGEGGDEEDFVV